MKVNLEKVKIGLPFAIVNENIFTVPKAGVKVKCEGDKYIIYKEEKILEEGEFKKGKTDEFKCGYLAAFVSIHLLLWTGNFSETKIKTMPQEEWSIILTKFYS